MATQYIRYPSQSSGGVPVYVNVAGFPATDTTGSLAVDASTGNLYEFNGTSWVQIAGPNSALGLGNLDAQSQTVKGAALVGGVLSMQSATSSFPGLINTTTQSFAGNKTFTGTISASNLSGTNSGDLTLGTSNGLSLTSQVLSLGTASTSTTGALTSTDWNTFNGKQASGNYITALTGDGTASGPGSSALTLATVNSNVGSYGSASSVPTFTVNAKGLTTAAGSTEIQISESQVTNLTSDLAGKQQSLTLTTTGTSGAATLSGGTLNIPNYATAGTVTSVSVVSANGLAGTVATSTTTPAITLSTTITGVLKGNGTAISAATSGSDYSAGTSALSTGILKSTTSTGTLSIAIAGTDYVIPSGSITGTSANITGTSNSTLTTLSALSLPASQISGNISLTTQVSNTLPITNGGTGQTSLISGGTSGSGTPALASGSYVPTSPSNNNVAGITMGNAQWLRVGNAVMVCGSLTCTPGGAGSYVNFTLPTTTANFSNSNGANGNATTSNGSGNIQGSITANYGAQTVQLYFNGSISTSNYYYTFMYQVQ